MYTGGQMKLSSDHQNEHSSKTFIDKLSLFRTYEEKTLPTTTNNNTNHNDNDNHHNDNNNDKDKNDNYDNNFNDNHPQYSIQQQQR
jgi:hypothetical protein